MRSPSLISALNLKMYTTVIKIIMMEYIMDIYVHFACLSVIGLLHICRVQPFGLDQSGLPRCQESNESQHTQ